MDSGQDILFIAIGGKDARKISSEPANSIFTKAMANEFYKIIVKQRCDALILDEESAGFYQNNLSVMPKDIRFAYMFIDSILNIIGNDPKSGFKDLKAELRKVPDVSYGTDGPEEIIEMFFKVLEKPISKQGYFK